MGIASVLLVLSTSPVFAWGHDGHRIVGEVAERFLEPPTARQVRELLALENATSLGEIGSWADDYRGANRASGPWHYVNIPVSASGYDAERDCPAKNCIVAKIDEFRAVLADESAAPRARLEALKFVVHFIADIHQPLHTSDNGDRGGNEVRVAFDGRSSNLHAVWDTGIIATTGMAEPDFSAQLAGTISEGDNRAWQHGSAADWANESHSIAKRILYACSAAACGPKVSGTLPASYATDHSATVRQQLVKAGVRLAAVLNNTLR